VFLTHHPRPGGGACTKLTLTTTAILLAVGAPAWVCSRGNDRTIGHLNPAEKAFHALFASAAMRSGGFAHRHERVHPITLLVSDALMFVGGGSASTAGGIKVATLAVLFLGIIAEARGDRHVIAAGRHIPDGSLRLAISVTFLGATPVLVATGAGDDRQHRAAGPILFEVISAFATCGLGRPVRRARAVREVRAQPAHARRPHRPHRLGRRPGATATEPALHLPEERPIIG
jgi:Trk-type K+ transport system membrane component